jgi:hypothetical protein
MAASLRGHSADQFSVRCAPRLAALPRCRTIACHRNETRRVESIGPIPAQRLRGYARRMRRRRPIRSARDCQTVPHTRDRGVADDPRDRLATAAPEALDPSDPTAKTLGYVTKSAKPDQQCGNCAQFQGKSGDSQGLCTLFPGKSVASGGWCMSWVKKLAT